MLAHRGSRCRSWRGELGVTEPPYEVVFGPVGAEEPHAEHGVLHVRWCERGGRLLLRLRHRTDVLDAEGAARIGGYHLRALRLLAADPDADHTQQSLLSADEVREQLEDLAGPRRPLPDAPAHELFEERVRERPRAVAAVHGERTWTYAELNARANRLARALLARGLGREDVVAVVTERNLDWLAATLAVFKAGGGVPADRAALPGRPGSRRRCRGPGAGWSSPSPAAPPPWTRRWPPCRRPKLLVETAYAEPHADGDLGVRVDPRSAGLHLLHLRLHRRAEGGDVRRTRAC